ncbi:hypothetical protein AAG570_008357 [Ranatra chinensis]|uniref:NAD(P)-binding domain-containing protein n=1 Tax=Ranatra chinensis TaxID=642074 RepID=A0ABD0XUX6_9HEMI
MTVRVLVRDEMKLPEAVRSRIEIVKGDVLDVNHVKDALTGSSYVVVALGTRNSLNYTRVMSDGLRNIISSMKELGIKIISVCLSAFLFYPPESVPERFRNIDDDHRLMLKILKESDLEWIAVLPPHITDNEKGVLIVSKDVHPGPRVISKYDLGQFLLDAVSSPQYYKCIVGVANKQEEVERTAA